MVTIRGDAAAATWIFRRDRCTPQVLAAALPFCYYVLWCFAVDPVEEVSIREKMKQQHVHTSG